MSKLVDALTSVGASAAEYKRPPISKDLFLVSIKPGGYGTILVNDGNADIELHTSKKHRQVVANVNETNRTVTRKLRLRQPRSVPVPAGSSRRVQVADWTPEQAGKEMLRRCNSNRSTFPVQFGPGVKPKYSVVGDPKPFTRRPWSGAQAFVEWMIEVQAQLPATSQSLLMGMDEFVHFISILPSPATSVAHAHEILRPKGVPLDAPRQGEFFFVPVTNAKLHKSLDTNASKTEKGVPFSAATYYHRRNMRSWTLPKARKQRLESDSSHIGEEVMRFDGKLYARGLIYDTRANRHAPLMLNGWHQVVRNLEHIPTAQENEMTLRRSRYYD